MSLEYPKLLQKTQDHELSLKHFSDEIITTHIYTKHLEDEKTKIDVNKYILFVESIVKTADRIAETLFIAQGSKGHLVFSDDSLKYNSSIDPPICTLHHISKELKCKAPGIENAHQATLDILNNLRSYPWEAKAVLTLTAFATEYGDMWHISHYSHIDPLAKSLAMIKRVTMLKKEFDSLKYRHIFLDSNSLIYSCLQAIKYMDELRNFSKYDTKDVPELSAALRQIPLVSYWVIHILAASSTEIHNHLSGAEGQNQKYLNELTEKIRSLLVTLERQLDFIRAQREEIDLFRWLVEQIDHFPTDVTMVLPKLLHGKIGAKPLINCSTQIEENIEEILKGKNLILVISKTLDISNDDIEKLHLIYNKVEREDKYKIVWIPIISDPLNEEQQEKYKNLKSRMKWYMVPYTTKIAGLRFLEEKWQLREDLLVVVLNSKSKIEFTNAIHLIRVWERDAIPFTYERTEALLRKNWIESTVVKFSDQPRLQNWINHERNIIFYGGNNPVWIQSFEEMAEAIKEDPSMREDGISFEPVRIGKNNKGEHDPAIMSRFWITQRSFFIIKHQLQGSSATEDILRLISYENENGWAILAKGSTSILVGSGNLILKTMEEFQAWKKNLHLRGFLSSFKDYFNELAVKNHRCSYVNILGVSGWIPLIITCPVCRRYMESGIRFECCHGGHET